MRAFCHLELGRDAIPDETTILNFRHLLETHALTRAVFEAVAALPLLGLALTLLLPRVGVSRRPGEHAAPRVARVAAPREPA